MPPALDYTFNAPVIILGFLMMLLIKMSDKKQHQKFKIPICYYCKNENEKMKVCSKCRTAFYCTIECQKSDWKNHKTRCNLRSMRLTNGNDMSYQEMEEEINIEIAKGISKEDIINSFPSQYNCHQVIDLDEIRKFEVLDKDESDRTYLLRIKKKKGENLLTVQDKVWVKYSKFLNIGEVVKGKTVFKDSNRLLHIPTLVLVN